MNAFLSSLLFVFISFSSYSFTVDTMFKIEGESDNYLTLKSNSEKEEYINIVLSSLDRVNGKMVEKNLDVNAFMDWPIYVSPSATILDPAGAQRINIIKVKENNIDDMMIGISLIPDTIPKYAKNSVNIALGYKVWYVIPGNSPFTGELKLHKIKSTLVLTNNTNKHLYITLNNCAKNITDNKCNFILFLLKGDKKEITLNTFSKGTKTLKIEYYDVLKKTVKHLAVDL